MMRRSALTNSSFISARPALPGPMYFVVVSRNLAPEAERQNWGARKALEVFDSRLGLVKRQLARSTYLAGDAFTQPTSR